MALLKGTMNNILVGNLHPNVTERNIRPLFEKHGPVKRFKLMTDHFTGLSRGFGFIEMKTDAEADEAIAALNGRDLNGKALKVTLVARPQLLRAWQERRAGNSSGRGERIVTPKTMSVGAQNAVDDMAELNMYLLGQTQQTLWPMLRRTRTNSFETRTAHSTSVESNAARELLDVGFLEASSKPYVCCK